MYIIYALLSAVFAGLVTIFAKLGLKNIDATLATSIRAIIMAVFLAGVVVITSKFTVDNIKNIETKDWILIAVSGIAGAISWIFYFIALQNSKENTSQIAALDKLSLVFVFIFAIIFLKEKLDIRVLVGVILMIIGAILTIK